MTNPIQSPTEAKDEVIDSIDRDDAVRNKILEEAERLITSSGTHYLSIDELINRLGLTESALLDHFLSREHLIEAVVKEMCAFSVPLFRRILTDLPGISGLIAYFRGYLSRLHLQASVRMCPISSLAGSAPFLSESSKLTYGEAYCGLIAEITLVLQTAGASHAEELAVSFMAQASGAFMLGRALPEGPAVDQLLECTLAKIVAELEALKP